MQKKCLKLKKKQHYNKTKKKNSFQQNGKIKYNQ